MPYDALDDMPYDALDEASPESVCKAYNVEQLIYYASCKLQEFAGT